MGFFGHSFTFDDIPCEEFDLMCYDVGGESSGSGEFASVVTIQEETIASKWKPYFYGTTHDGKKLEFSMVFGVSQDRIDSGRYLDRYELNGIASWLTGHDAYKWLTIEQDDMSFVRYNCIITSLSVVEFGKIPWALQATVTCDSPYGYMSPQTFSYEINGTANIQIENESCLNRYYMPIMDIYMNGGDFVIKNISDGGRRTAFTSVPASVSHIKVDNDNLVITNDQDINLYPNFNFTFLRLKKGINALQVTGHGTLEITCEFPINTGG